MKSMLFCSAKNAALEDRMAEEIDNGIQRVCLVMVCRVNPSDCGGEELCGYLGCGF